MTGALPEVVERRRIRVRGVVQGVGFRPFVHRLATRDGLGGRVWNDGEGVVVEVEGPAALLDAFTRGLADEAPPLARVASITGERVAPVGEQGFLVVTSRAEGRSALVPPDVATCDDCLRELHDPADRRYRYPFVNCTNCGPRLTIVTRVPYDRPNTTMAGFPLCEDCRGEYEDPSDRRFHAEPIACPVCGPRLSVPLEEAVAALRDGAIVAVKGLGGYHLACDATSERAVARLRERKGREEKPLAVMSAEPLALAEPTPEELDLLGTPARPIVLVRRRADAPVAPSVAPGTPWLGLMLPYTPLHHLLCADVARPLVMTSGNLSDEPIAFDDDRARRRLGDVADLFLAHDRPIHRRCEDSVVRAGFPLRRSRGYAPAALPLPVPLDRPLVAAGAELKSTFCVARGGEAFLSSHLGDLTGEDAYAAFRDDLELWLDMLGVEPAALACDLHPDYLSTRWAWEQGLPVVEVQHHHAHAAACLAEHGESGPALAVVLDGTGFGTDGTIWGGEVLRCDLTALRAPRAPRARAAARRRGCRARALAHRERLPRAHRAAGFPGRDGASSDRASPSTRRSPPARGGCSTPARRSSACASGSATRGRRRSSSSTSRGTCRQRPTSAASSAASSGDPSWSRLRTTISQRDGLVPRSRPPSTRAWRRRSRRPASRQELPRRSSSPAAACRTCACSARCGRGSSGRGFRVLSHRVVPPNDGGVSYGQAAVAAARLACA